MGWHLIARKLSGRLGQSRLEPEPHLLTLFLSQMLNKYLLEHPELGGIRGSAQGAINKLKKINQMQPVRAAEVTAIGGTPALGVQGEKHLKDEAD